MRHLTTNSGQAGVTLVELLTVIVIVAILMAIGVPSFRYVTTANRVATESDALLGDLQYARSEAIREGQQVTVCLSTDHANCDTASNPPTWQEGWIVFSNPNNKTGVDANDPLLRVNTGFTSTGDTFQSSNTTGTINFSGEGFANIGAASMAIKLHDATANTVYTHCLVITQAGMMSVKTPTSDPTDCPSP